MSNALIAFLLSAGAGMWIYNKMLRNSGGNAKSATIIALSSAALLFFVSWFILSAIVP